MIQTKARFSRPQLGAGQSREQNVEIFYQKIIWIKFGLSLEKKAEKSHDDGLGGRPGEEVLRSSRELLVVEAEERERPWPWQNVKSGLKVSIPKNPSVVEAYKYSSKKLSEK